MERCKSAKAPRGALAKNKKAAATKTSETPTTSNAEKAKTGHSTSTIEVNVAAIDNRNSAPEPKAEIAQFIKTTTTMPPPIEMPKKRRMRIMSAPNIAKRRTIATTELPSDGMATAKKATTSSAYTTEDEECSYVSEGGEGLYRTGDSNLFDDLSSPEVSDDDIEHAIVTKINTVQGEIDQLQQKLAPLIQALRSKQEARRAREEQERDRKKSNQAPVENAPTQKKDGTQKQSPIPPQKATPQQQQQQQLPKQTQKKQRQQPKEQQQQTQQQQEQKQQQQQHEPQQRQQQQQSQQQQSQVQKTNKKDRVPPINAYRMELQETINLCKSAIGQNFIIKRLGKDKHSIQCSSLEHHKIIKDLLKQTTTEFFSFTPKVEKLQTVLLKGIDSCTEPQVLLEELRQKAGDDLEFIGVKPFSTVNSRREKRKLPIFLVQLSPNSKLDRLRSISVLNYQVVSWDTLKRRGDMLQCMRCQRFGHAAANCEMQSRCVKCGENHNVNECKLGNERVEDRTLLKCIVCHGEGHPANYRGCPGFQQIRQQKKAKQSVPVVEVRPPKRALTSIPVNPQISYAQMASGRGNTAQSAPKAAQPALVPRAPDAQSEIRSMLLAIQGQLAGLQNQIREQATRVDYLYSRLPSFTLVG